ncbi:phage holin family protein [Oceaniglobus indicus]|uniref:phage holin family protein n=1 Tax=Oceaniglobus indicus TaxID=2047749 RepID=UPI000C19C1CD|nr:phage holin family protein [Oceaniglobus indicus]
MIAPLIYPLRRAIALAVRRAVFGSAAGLLILVGSVFLTIAAWIFLAQQLGSGLAALILGLVFIGIGLIVLALGLRNPVRHVAPPPPPPPAAVDTVALVNAFLSGLAAGGKIKRK